MAVPTGEFNVIFKGHHVAATFLMTMRDASYHHLDYFVHLQSTSRGCGDWWMDGMVEHDCDTTSTAARRSKLCFWDGIIHGKWKMPGGVNHPIRRTKTNRAIGAGEREDVEGGREAFVGI